MTEDCNTKDADYIVRVKAQVMTRDDSSGGWVPMGGGGMSEVGLRKIVISSGDGDILNEYHIHGQKILDRSVVLNCVLKKDVQYIKANPTFHHWMMEDKRFGLTFQSSAEARAFDKGVKRAVEDLVEGYSEGQDGEVGEEVFMTMELPLGRKGSWSQSASTASTTTSSPQSPASSFSLHDTFPAPPPPHLHRMHYIRPPPPPPLPVRVSERPATPPQQDIWVMKQRTGSSGEHPDLEITDFSYVEFNKNKSLGDSQPPAPPPLPANTTSGSSSSQHEYSYPTLDCVSPMSTRSSSSCSQHKQQSTTSTAHHHHHHHHHHHQHTNHHMLLEPQLPSKSKKKKAKLKKNSGGSGTRLLSGSSMGRRSRCIYCHELFSTEDNMRGQCEDAPDRVANCIEKVSCLCCARGLLYHCMSDADGDYGEPDPCTCGGMEGGGAASCKKWTALAILSLFVPCLWCYWPLMACHRCGVSCACCGGRHKAAAAAAT